MNESAALPDRPQGIDRVVHSPDLLVREAAIIPSRASNPLPMVATIDRRR